MSIIVNLPVETLNTIIDIDNKLVEVPIIEFNGDDSKTIRTMYTIPDCSEKIIKYEHDISYITHISKETVVNTNNIRYFKISFTYYNDKTVEYIIPGYVKFFSKTTRSYVPVEFIKKSDMLIDYQGYNVQVNNNEAVQFEAVNYYNIIINSANDMQTTFYLNGILSYVSYNNFNKKELVENA